MLEIEIFEKTEKSQDFVNIEFKNFTHHVQKKSSPFAKMPGKQRHPWEMLMSFSWDVGSQLKACQVFVTLENDSINKRFFLYVKQHGFISWKN